MSKKKFSSVFKAGFQRLWEPLLAAVLFWLIVCCLGPWWNVYSLENDEGINLMKASLVAEGHRLYTDIWSDQPPLFTYLLALVHKASHGSVVSARAVELMIAGVLLAFFFTLVRRREGRFAAWIAVITLASCRLFLKMSVPVLIGLPAVAFAVLAMDQVSRFSVRSNCLHLWLGGILFAVSVQIKFFTLPLLIVLIFLAGESCQASQTDHQRRSRLIQALQVLIAASGTFVIIACLTHATSFNQLLAPHISAKSLGKFYTLGGLNKLLVWSWKFAAPAVLFGGLGLVISVCKRPQKCLIPLIWLGLETIVLATHRPLWWHHLILIAVPLAWLAGCGATYIVTIIAKSPSRSGVFKTWAQAGIICLIFLCSMQSFSKAHKAFSKQPTPAEIEVCERLTWFSDTKRWVVTDMPMDAYRAGLLVPPPIAVFSEKRRSTGNLSDDTIKSVIETYRPAQISLRRFTYTKSFTQWLYARANEVPAIFKEKNNSRFLHLVDWSTLDNAYCAAGKNVPNTISQNMVKPGDAFAALLIETLKMNVISKLQGFGGVHDLSNGHRYERSASGPMIGSRQVVARPPQSAQQIGSCFLAAYRATGKKQFLQPGLSAGAALACTQTKHGGWKACGAQPKTCPGICGTIHPIEEDKGASFDDGTIPTVIDFAFSLKDTLATDGIAEPAWLSPMIASGLDFILQSQDRCGGWPQKYREGKYHSLMTLNDGAMSSVIHLLLKAYYRTGDSRYLNAAKKGGDFLITVQGPKGQSGWAQQYSTGGKPMPARAMEPACYSSLETAYAMISLLELYARTGDGAFYEPLIKSRDWLLNAQIAPNIWARFYEPGSNIPVYFDRSGNLHRRLSELPANEQTAYRWKGGREVFPEIIQAINLVGILETGGQEELARAFSYKSDLFLSAYPTANFSPKPVPIEKLVRNTLSTSDESGQQPLLSTKELVTNCAALLKNFERVSARTPEHKHALPADNKTQPRWK